MCFNYYFADVQEEQNLVTTPSFSNVKNLTSLLILYLPTLLSLPLEFTDHVEKKRSQRVQRKDMKCHLLDRTWWVHSWAQNSCGLLHKVEPANIPAKKEVLSRFHPCLSISWLWIAAEEYHSLRRVWPLVGFSCSNGWPIPVSTWMTPTELSGLSGRWTWEREYRKYMERVERRTEGRYLVVYVYKILNNEEKLFLKFCSTYKII